ncbi:hypothetical protein GLA29479_610 [Lysobacter antibioticus]|uniref:hypothetical protein n=1 Tax=Lysobacter antibioticus TaxID=84531 RepID=UPI000716EFC4|nr:hypothetical protein [Lysobacter antibioticus]ALN61495.1 hypothetical protein GLA29479_610 [Lysobacter antibioticus]
MELGPIPGYLKDSMRKHFLAGLRGHRSLEIYELDLFRWFRNETEETWTKMEAEEQEYIQEQVSAGAEEINDSGVVAVGYYRKRARYSHVIFVASLLESAIKRECDRLSTALGDKILFKPSELKGDPWSARKTYLERHGSFETPDDLWSPIKNLLALRNALVHHNGERLSLTKEQISALGKIAGVDVTHSEIGVEAAYLDQATESVGKLMEFVHERTNSVIDRAVKPQAVK